MPPTPTAPASIDFFVSYTGKDQAWAEWIAWQLEQAGYSTIIQAWDFKSGGVFPGDMHRALQQSTRVIAVLTPDYMKSDFCAPEWQAAFKQDPTGEKGILVCVRVAAFQPDGLLAGRTYIDLVGKTPDAARDLLLARLKPGRAKPAAPPPHPVSSPAPTYPGTTSAPASPDIPSNLPGGYIARQFFGREDFLQKLRASLLSQTQATAITQSAVPSPHTPAATSLAGLGGIGKTHTAIAYANRYRADYTALLFVSGETPARLHATLADLGPVLHLDREGDLPPDEAARVHLVTGWLASHDDWLLIVDNVDDPAAARTLTALLGRLTRGHVLITTRLHGWADSIDTLDLAALDLDPAADLLLALTMSVHHGTGEDRARARLLAEDLGCLPLALQQAGGYITEQHLTLGEAREFYQSEARDLLGWFDEMSIPYAAPQDVGPLPVLFTWKASFDKLSDDTRRWLRVFAFYAPETIPEFLYQSAPEDDEEQKHRRRAIRQALAQAGKYCLLTWESEPAGFKLHRLVQHILRLSAIEAGRHQALAEGIQLIGECNPGNPFDVRSWPRWNLLQAHAQALCTHAPDAPAPQHLSWLLGQLDCLFDTKGLPFEAEKYSRRALAIDEASFGKDHPDVAIRLNNLAALLQSTNRHAEAEPLMRRALAIDEANFGPDHPEVAIDLNNLAQLLQSTNRHAEAEPLMRRALAIDEASLGGDHPNLARDLNNLAQLLQATNRLAEAEPLIRRALTIDEASFGPDHPNVAIRLNNLAQLLRATNRPGEAEPVMRRALTIDEASFGGDHPNVARDLNNLARLLQSTNRLDEAEPLMRRALGIFTASYGPEHPSTQTVQDNLNRLLAELKRKGR